MLNVPPVLVEANVTGSGHAALERPILGAPLNKTANAKPMTQGFIELTGVIAPAAQSVRRHTTHDITIVELGADEIVLSRDAPHAGSGSHHNCLQTAPILRCTRQPCRERCGCLLRAAGPYIRVRSTSDTRKFGASQRTEEMGQKPTCVFPARLTTAGASTELLKERSQRVQFRAKATPIPDFQPLNCAVIVAECLARSIVQRTCGRSTCRRPRGRGTQKVSLKSAASAPASVSSMTTRSP